MHVHEHAGSATARRPFRLPLWLGFCAFLAIVVFFLWSEHRAHILGGLPYVLLLLCPALHLLMHGGHGDHHQNDGRGGASQHIPGEKS